MTIISDGMEGRALRSAIYEDHRRLMTCATLCTSTTLFQIVSES
jgi:hypothetical protein